MAKNEIPIFGPSLAQAHDLKLIHGIGPGIEKRLNEAGIHSYSQLASMTPTEIFSAIGDMIGLTVKRIEDQDWVGQAKQLQPANRTDPRNINNGQQHYATFTVEFLLDDANSVRRTRVTYIQGENEQAWAGWDAKRLGNTICEQAGLNIPILEKKVEDEALKPAESKETGLGVEPVLIKSVEMFGSPQLKETRITSQGSTFPRRIQAADRPLEISLSLDPGGMMIPEDSNLAYVASVDAKELHTHAHLTLGEDKGTLIPGQQWNLAVKCSGLKEGTYRISTDLSLSLAGEGQDQSPQITANFDGGLLRVY
ncbi:MAG: hypothetical protein P4L50_29665 [Anaerolineaceae bacterium]|nr:hypothetical protein [Anaerolineaceae bacterium]